MSTIPFTLIEGAIAQPRVRPLDGLPAPFGRDWALLPPGHSWRAELKALYAAMLRTFCMSDEAIFSFCRWVPFNTRRAAVGSGSAVKSAAGFDAPRGEALHVFSDAGLPAAVGGPVFVTVQRRAAPHWGALVGGACALSGAAILAWMAFAHLTHHSALDAVKSASTATDRRGAESVQSRALASASASASASNSVMQERARQAVTREGDARAQSAVSARAEVALTDARASTRASTQTKATAAPNTSPTAAATHRPPTLRETTYSPRERTRRHLARSAVANPLPQLAAMADEMPRLAVPPSAQRASPRPSASGSYSQLAPAQLGSDEYADVTMSAATHLREFAAASGPATSNNPSASSGTEWMNHMSQRRVTEIPDQFAR